MRRMITGQSAPITATLAGVRMSAVGHSLPNRDVRVTSVQPSISDLMLRRRERRNGPISTLWHRKKAVGAVSVRSSTVARILTVVRV
jgi:hypothetical protein